MVSDRLPRKLVAILYADVAGYSRLTGEDEDGTHRRLSTYLDLISDSIRSGNGAVVHYAGDAVLAQFPTATEALACAARIQQRLLQENAELPDEKSIAFRIGVNLGEVIFDRNDIYGDGVNVAARLESLAVPGGICISESVHSAVGNKLPIEYVFLGEQPVKNIDKPVRAYHAAVRAGAALPALPRRSDRRRSLKVISAIGMVACLVILIGVLLAKFSFLHPTEMSGPKEVGYLPLPDQPSIAVLPFVNLSGTEEQSYFVDGITEDVITNLSRFEDLFVISRTSSFAYKGKGMKTQLIGRELGVRYLLEGSVQRHEDQLRVSAQLVEASTGKHLWAERYDRRVDDVFAIQDEITDAIAATLGEALWKARASEIGSKPTSSFEAYDYRLRATEYIHRFTKDDNLKARENYEKALELDPDFAIAYIGLGWTYALDFIAKWSKIGPEVLDAALGYAHKAVRLNPTSAEAYRLIARIYQLQGRHDEALATMKRALVLNPNNSDFLAQYGVMLIYAGHSEEGMEWAAKAIRRNPHYPSWYASAMASGHYLNRQYREALEYLNRIDPPKMWDHRLLAAIHAELDETTKAKEHVESMLAINPDLTIATIAPAIPYQNRADVDRILASLRKAGMPE